jgi:Sec-independent protein translocase protein TatA
MSKLLERWLHYDAERAWRLEREIKVWCAYFGMLCLGGVLFSAPMLVWGDRYITAMRGQYQAEVQRLQDTNSQLIVVIQDRLPAITKTAASAAETAKTAAETAKSAAQTAKAASTGAGKAAKVATGAAVEAKSAATTVKGAAEDLTQALTPPTPAPPAEVPDWLNTP